MTLLKGALVALLITLYAAPALAASPTEAIIYQKCRIEFTEPKAREKARYYAPLIERAAKKHGLPPTLVARVAWHESNFKPRLVSHAGARGLMQVMPFHFKRGQSWKDPATNLDVGCGVLKSYLKRFDGDWHRALTAYCYGPRIVSRGKYRSRYSKAILARR